MLLMCSAAGVWLVSGKNWASWCQNGDEFVLAYTAGGENTIFFP